MNRSFIILFTFCAVLVMGFAIYKSVQAEGHTVFQSMLAAPTEKYANPISDSLAYKMFIDYNKSTGPERSQGVLRSGGDAIIQFYVDKEQLIAPLEAKAASLGLEFMGLSAIPGYNEADSSHTLIWVAVVDADPGEGVLPKLMLPDRGETWTDYIYDHISKCPSMCPENSNWLWNQDWAE